MFPFIVADIGGTNARFALVTSKLGDQFNFEHILILKGADYSSFEEAMAHYVQSLSGIKASAACVAIAGPIDGDVVTMTNLPWSFSQQALKDRFELNAFLAINDYTAQAVATSRLGDTGLATVLSGTRNNYGNKAILGPGTGLGVAGLARMPMGWLPISSEGGHVNMAAFDLREAQVLQTMMGEYEYVSAEMCLSGAGLVNLYRALAKIHGVEAQLFKPADISLHAIENSNDLCREALNLFCGFLGSVSANLALTYGASGGVYITGGIVPRFVDFLRQSPFESRFRCRGKMSHYVDEIPVDVITYQQTAFLGAAAWLYQTLS